MPRHGPDALAEERADYGRVGLERRPRIFRWGETAVQLDAIGEFTAFNLLIRTV